MTKITWAEKIARLKLQYGRMGIPLSVLIEESKGYQMTEEEVKTQSESFARANVSTGDPEFD